MNKTKIDWCECEINPVVGCPNGCEYCYAEKINCRFHFVKNWKQPEFFPERLKQFKSKMPKSVFINSMSDIGTWKEEWLEQVLLAMQLFSHHKYIALTKTNVALLKCKLDAFCNKYEGNLPLYIGKSITTQEQVDALQKNECTDFLSIEPILEGLDLSNILWSTRQLIIGAETGNRKGKIVPSKEWITNIVKQADMHGLKVFMKESLRKIMGNDFRQDKLIWER